MSHPRIKAALAGVEAGVLGGLVMLAALGVSSILERDAWWSYPNLLGATFYGSRVLRSGPGWATASGIALQLVLAGSAGALFATTFGKTPAGLRAVLGVAWGALLFYVSREMYRLVAPLVALYAPDTSMLLGHMLLGVFFARVRLSQGVKTVWSEQAPNRHPRDARSREIVGAMPTIGDLPAQAGDRDPTSTSG